MNPAIVIPSYWSSSVKPDDPTALGTYDHATPLGAREPELATCLDSLDEVRGVVRVIVLLVATPADERVARARVDELVAQHPNLSPLVIGSREPSRVSDAIEAITPEMAGETVSLRGYGAIKNMGLAVSAILGHDVVVFLDDDEVALSPEFLVDAVYGLGQVTRNNQPIVAKSGYFIDRADSPYADESNPRWYDHWWAKRSGFNEWMRGALAGTRISRSNSLCGGCFAVHAAAFTRVAFDPWITRGEDLDYLIDLRLYGLDVWFDNKWCVRHLPPSTPSAASRFRQDVYRWAYEWHKLAMANGKIDLQQVTSASLMPYPGPWLDAGARSRAAKTALAHAVGCPEHGEYWDIFLHGRKDAENYGESMSSSYLKFQTFWPRVMVGLWEDHAIAADLLAGIPARPVRPVMPAAPVAPAAPVRPLSEVPQP